MTQLIPHTAELLADAFGVLRELPRDRHAADAARRAVQAWNLLHPEITATLVVDAPPGSVRLDHDLLVTFPGAGTLALSWREDTGSPWSVCYADHWAANFVVTVGERRLTVQQALQLLRTSSELRPEQLTTMVDHLLFQELTEDDTLAATDAELQDAADQFRRRHGLCSAAATVTWLTEHRLSEANLAAMLEHAVRIAKAKDRIVEARLAAWFERHRGELDRAQVLEVGFAAPEAAARAAAEARDRGLLPALARLALRDTAALATRFVRELPAAARGAAPGELIGPIADGDRHVIYQLLERQPARLDDETRALARRLICEAWAAERRELAVVRWHWM